MVAARRNYKKEYASYHAKPVQKKRRAGRNKARNGVVKSGVALKGSTLDVHHRDGNPTNNRRSNLRITSRRTNRRAGNRGV